MLSFVWRMMTACLSSRANIVSMLLSHEFKQSHQRSTVLDPHRRLPRTVPRKLFHIFVTVIVFCILLYIPIYNKANISSSNSELLQAQEVSVPGWTIDKNRDIRVYVQPNNDTSVHKPKEICTKTTRDKSTLFLVIVVCSSVTNFDQRKAIRDTWGDSVTYYKISKTFNALRDKSNWKLEKQLARVLQIKQVANDELNDRLEDNNYMLSEFYSNELDEHIEPNYNFNSRGNDLKFMKNIASNDNMPDFKVVFLLGLPTNDNSTTIKAKLEEEVKRYGDIIQESFVDSYYNLTMKSIMMLKWVTNDCKESVRYILKTDDDCYVNVPNLIANIHQRSKEYDDKLAKGFNQDEYLLMGYTPEELKPVRNSSNKWYSPRYMYSGDIYPGYLSGTGYVLSAPTVRALYKAALTTPYFHIEDVYITGMCARRAKPSIVPRYGFTYENLLDDPCLAHNYVITHRVNPSQMRLLHQSLLTDVSVERCERIRKSQNSYTLRFKNWVCSLFA